MEIRTNEETKTYFWNRITRKDMAVFYEHLSNLVEGGVTVIDALNAFLDKTPNPKLEKEVINLLVFIDSGDNFSTAMKKLPDVFDKKDVSIIEAGESSGTMQKSFEALSIQLREQEELKQKVKSALTYPGIILVFLILSVFIIMTYVVPKIIPLFANSDTEIPLATRSLIFVSDLFINNKFLILFIGIVIFGGIKVYSKTAEGKKMLDGIYLNIPIVGSIYRNYIISQISSNLGVLIGAGIPIIKTLRLTGESSNNLIYQELIEEVSNGVGAGKKIVQSITEADPEHRYFPNDFVQIMAAGEKTSTINKVCVRLNNLYKKEVEYSISILMKWVEPLALLIAGVFVLWFAFAIFSAVLKITETVGQ